MGGGKVPSVRVEGPGVEHEGAGMSAPAIPQRAVAIHSCGGCGGALTAIRGRYPGSARRMVCPTCLADRLDIIREYADPEYPRQAQANPR